MCSSDLFLSHVQPLTKSRDETRIQDWMDKLKNDHHPTGMGITPTENLPPGSETLWAQCKTLNRFRTRTGRSKDAQVRWGFKTAPTTCEWGEEDQTMETLSALYYPTLAAQKTLKTIISHFSETKRRGIVDQVKQTCTACTFFLPFGHCVVVSHLKTWRTLGF